MIVPSDPRAASPGAGDSVTLVVDGNNVMGSRPDGWWRDRAGAARRLLARVQCHAAQLDHPVVVVFDVPLPDVPEGEHGGVTVRYGRRPGRDSADDRIIGDLQADSDAGGGRVELVTSDRALASRARAQGAVVTGSGAFLALLDRTGC
ncbi:MAG TPA: NYN domain-containing protein [Acidimicrobiales bacterium]